MNWNFAIILGLILIVAFCKAEFSEIIIKDNVSFDTLKDALSKGYSDANVVLDKDLEITLNAPLGMRPDGVCNYYNGTFSGNGHKIILTMNVPDLPQDPIKDAALFCGLENGAYIDDLTITGTISGRFASSLALVSTGSMTLKKVKASVNVEGRDRVAGLIVNMNIRNESTVIIEDCSTEGTISGTTNAWVTKAGGFFAIVSGMRNDSVSCVFNGCTNDMTVKGDIIQTSKYSSASYAGGFVGHIVLGHNISMVFNKCINSGKITSSSNVAIDSTNQFLGGFVGFVSESYGIQLTFNQCSNTGDISSACTGGVLGSSSIGGIIGYTDNNENFLVLVNGSSNMGTISSTCNKDECDTYAGGFVGKVFTYTAFYNDSVSIINSNSEGSVLVSSGTACGVLCVDPNFRYGITTEVDNTVIKNEVAGINAYGVGNLVDKVNGVAVLGVISSFSDVGNACSFWAGGAKVNADSLFSFNNSASCGVENIQDVDMQDTVFVVGEEKLAMVLNKVAFLHRFGLYWDDDLQQLESISFQFHIIQYGYPYFDSELVTDEATRTLHTDDGFDWYVAGGCCKNKVDSDTHFSEDVTLVQCVQLSILDKSFLMEYDSKINDTCTPKDVVDLFSKNHIIDSNMTVGIKELSLESTINRDTTLLATQKVVVTGGPDEESVLFVVDGKSLAEDDKVFGDKELFKKFSFTYVIIDSETGAEYKNNTKITKDLDLRACHKLTIIGLEKGVWYVQNKKSIFGEDGVFGDMNLLNSSFNDYHLVNLNTVTEYRRSSVLASDIDLARCYRVLVHDSKLSLVYAIPGTALDSSTGLYGQVSVFSYIFEQYHVMDSSLTIKYSLKQVVNEDLDLFFAYQLTLTGEINGTYYVGQGKPLKTCPVLEPYLNQTTLYSVWNTEKPTSVYSAESVITSDTNLTVHTNCDGLDEEKCTKALTCTYSGGKCKSADDQTKDDNTGLIVALCIVGVIVLVGIAFAVIIPLYLKKKKDSEMSHLTSVDSSSQIQLDSQLKSVDN